MTTSALPAASQRTFRFASILTAAVLTVLLLWLLGSVAHVLLLLFIAIIVSLYLGAVADLFTRKLHVPRRAAFWLGFFATLAGVIGLFVLLIPPVVDQVQQLIRVLPATIAKWETSLGELTTRVPALQEVYKPGENRIAVALYEKVTGAFQDILPKIFGLVHAAISIFSVVVMSLYLALYPQTYREFTIALFPPVHRDLVRDLMRGIADKLRSWSVAQLIAMSLLAALTALGLYLLHVPFWLAFGVFTGVVAIVPFFGTLVSTVLPAFFVLSGTGIWGFGPVTHALLVILLGTVVHLVEANIIIPLVNQEKTHLPPVLTIISVLIVGKLLGLGGLLIAVPLLVVTMEVVRRILLTRIYEGQGFRRAARDRALVLRVPAPDGAVAIAEGPPLDVIAIAERMALRKSA